MKKAILSILLLALYSCQSLKDNSGHTLSPAAKEVQKMINHAERNAKKAAKGKTYSQIYVDELSELTGISARVVDCGWAGVTYDLKIADVAKWKTWFEENASEISYYENEDINKYYFYNEDKIIMVKISPDEYQYSVHPAELEHIKYVAEEIKKRRSNK